MRKTKTPLYVLFGADTAAAQALIAMSARYNSPLLVTFAPAPPQGIARGFAVLDITQPPRALASRIAGWRLQAQADSVWLLCPTETPLETLFTLLQDAVLAAHCALKKLVWYAQAGGAPQQLAAASQAAQAQLAQCDLLVLDGAEPKTLKQARRIVAALQPDIEAVSTSRPQEVAAALGSPNLLQPLRIALVLAACALLLVLPRLSLSVTDSIAIYLGTLLQALPFLMLGILLSSAIQVLIPADFLQRIFPKNLLGGMLFGLLGGFILPVCDCASVPVFRSLVKRGVPVPAAITFMLSAPVINPVVMLSTYYAFGGNVRIMLTRMAFGTVCSLLIGLLFSRHGQNILLSTATPALCACGHDHGEERPAAGDPQSYGPAACACGHHHTPTQTHGDDAHRAPAACGCGHTTIDAEAPLCQCHHSGVKPAQPGSLRHPLLRRVRISFTSLVAHFTDEFFEVVKYLLIGIAVSTVLQMVLGKTLLGVSITNLPEALLFMMAMAFLLSLCSSSDAVVGKNMGASLPMGAVMGFLVFGPMMDIKNLILMSANFTRRFMVELLLATAAICFAAVYLVYALGLGAMLA